MNQVVESGTDREWQEKVTQASAEYGPDWLTLYQPGSFGCHELLDRLHLMGDLVEGQVLDHPACAVRAEWHELASRAVEALRELYQRVGEVHLADAVSAERGIAPDGECVATQAYEPG